MVVTDFCELHVSDETDAPMRRTTDLPSALEFLADIKEHTKGKQIVVFLDYDGTLTPIVSRPDQAVLSKEMRETMGRLATLCTVGVISGRDLRDVQKHVGIDEIFYAGSHGFDIGGPKGRHIVKQEGMDFLPVLDLAEHELRDRLQKIPGSYVERKRFSIAVHYRQVDEDAVGEVEAAVDQVVAHHAELRKSHGKKVYELQPSIDWDKGKAVLWLLDALGLDQPDVLPIYIGDDLTDEDVFRALTDRGMSIVVKDTPHSTVARYALNDPEDVRRFLKALISLL